MTEINYRVYGGELVEFLIGDGELDLVATELAGHNLSEVCVHD